MLILKLVGWSLIFFCIQLIYNCWFEFTCLAPVVHPLFPPNVKLKNIFAQLPCYFIFYKSLPKQKLLVFWRSITVHHFRIVNCLLLGSLPVHKFVYVLYYFCYQCCCAAAATTTTTTDCKKLGCTMLGWLLWCNVHTKFLESQFWIV